MCRSLLLPKHGRRHCQPMTSPFGLFSRSTSSSPSPSPPLSTLYDPLCLSAYLPLSLFPLASACASALLLLRSGHSHSLREPPASTLSTLQIGSMQIDNIPTNDTPEAERDIASRAETPGTDSQEHHLWVPRPALYCCL